jgi:NADH-quinone oxidoreductase subunit C
VEILLEIPKETLVKRLEGLKSDGFNYLKKITAVDYKDHLEVVYFLYNLDLREEQLVVVKLPTQNAEIETVLRIYPAADWYERELSEMFGIKILGREAKRLLLEEWDGVDAPLRRSFVWGQDYKKV